MTEASPPAAKAGRPAGARQLFIDLGPVLIYVAAFNILKRFEATEESAVFIATGVFIAAVLAAIAYCKFQYNRIPPVLLVSGAIVVGFGGLTIALRDPTFIQLKPTAANLFFAVSILVSLAIRQNVWRLLFGHLYNLPSRIWDVLAMRWAGYFGFQAGLNELIRNTQSLDFWINSRPIMVFVPFVIFAVLITPLVLKHHVDEPADGANESSSR
jgi:intracellular septation protein